MYIKCIWNMSEFCIWTWLSYKRQLIVHTQWKTLETWNSPDPKHWWYAGDIEHAHVQ